MASSLTEPDVLSQAIATNGDKNTIPNTNDQSLGQMSQSTGFPPICSERIADGGKAPRRADFNGAFNLLSQHNFYLQNGGQETFRQAVSDAIGGYPAGAILFYKPSVGDVMIVRSEINNNTYNFNDDPSYIDGLKWKVVTPTLGGNNTWTGATTFTGTVDFTNSTTVEKITTAGMPDWSRATTITLPYTPTENGYIVRNVYPNSYIHLNIGNTGIKSFAGATSNSVSVYLPTAKGVEYTLDLSHGSWDLIFVPCSSL